MIRPKSANTIKITPLQNCKIIWKHFRFIEISIYLHFDFVLLTESPQYVRECTGLHILSWFHNFKLTPGYDYPPQCWGRTSGQNSSGGRGPSALQAPASLPRRTQRPSCGKGMPARQAPGVGGRLRCGLYFTQDGLGQLGPDQWDSQLRPKNWFKAGIRNLE